MNVRSPRHGFQPVEHCYTVSLRASVCPHLVNNRNGWNRKAESRFMPFVKYSSGAYYWLLCWQMADFWWLFTLQYASFLCFSFYWTLYPCSVPYSSIWYSSRKAEAASLDREEWRRSDVGLSTWIWSRSIVNGRVSCRFRHIARPYWPETAKLLYASEFNVIQLWFWAVLKRKTKSDGITSMNRWKCLITYVHYV